MKVVCNLIGALPTWRKVGFKYLFVSRWELNLFAFPLPLQRSKWAGESGVFLHIYIYPHLYLQHLQAVSFTVFFTREVWGNFKKDQLCYIFMMVGWALEENHSELTWSKESSIGFIVHTGSSNLEVNMDTMDFTNLLKVHWVGSGGFVGVFCWVVFWLF